MAPRQHECFAACAPGLEVLVAVELAGLGARGVRATGGGVTFRGPTKLLYAANIGLRAANRVLVRAGRFEARSFAELELGLENIDWAPYVRDGVTVRVAAAKSRLHHTDAIAERVVGLLGAGEQPVFVRLDHDRVLVSIDSTGDHLHRRGWRLDVAKAPMRETLAAALLLGSGWNGSTALADPCCGSGTIAIEAALLAERRAPGLGRSFALQGWPSFEPGTWAAVRGGALAAVRERTASIVAADRDAGAVRAALANAERAGVTIDVRRGPVAALELDGPGGLVLTNPPYGGRLGSSKDPRDLYAALGHLARSHGWAFGVLTSDPHLAAATGLATEARFRTTNGGIPVTLWRSPPPDTDHEDGHEPG